MYDVGVFMTEQNSFEEHRQSRRVDYTVSIDVASDDNFFTGFVKNISNGGLFIATDNPAPIGTRLTVRFTIPTLPDYVTANVVVRWIRKGSSQNDPDVVPGIGVQFIDLEPKVVDAINKFIEKHETLFYE